MLTCLVGGPHCPVPDHGETQSDCPWAAFSRRLSREADEGKPISALFEMLAPEISTQLRADAKAHGLKELWDPRGLLNPGKVLAT